MELSSRKLHALFLAEKIQALELLDESKISQSEVARRFRVSQLQIFICKTRETLLAGAAVLPTGSAGWFLTGHPRPRHRLGAAPGGLSQEKFICFVHLEGEDLGLGVCEEEVGTAEEGEEENGSLEPLPTKADALGALGTLRGWLGCHDLSQRSDTTSTALRPVRAP